MMVGLRGLSRLHWAPIREDVIYDFLRGIKNIDKIQFKAIVKGQKVKITCGVISKMLLLPYQGLNTEWLSPLQHGIPKMCKNLVDKMVVPRKEGWLVMKMKRRYVQRVGTILQMV